MLVKRKRRLFAFLLALVMIVSIDYISPKRLVEAATSTTGVVNTTLLNVRTGQGTKYAIKKLNGKKVRLKKNTKVTIKKTYSSWYYVSFTYNNKSLTGYVMKKYISIAKKTTNKKTSNTNSKTTITNTLSSKDNYTSTMYVSANKLNVRTGPGTNYSILQLSGKDVVLSKGNKVSILSTKGDWYYILFTYNSNACKGYINGDYVSYTKTTTTNTTFEQQLVNEGFPESYKVLLRKLHTQYPTWKFKSYKTGISFETAVKNEMVKGRSLIPTSKNIAWKSMNSDSYNKLTDKFVCYDGSSWVNASEAVVKHYMDPRNFLYKNDIYQFENLSYNSTVQNQAGVENILKNSAMYKTKVSYTLDKKKYSKYYSELFMAAAKYSKVSPYHLASRSKQEVCIGKNALSYSANGKLSGYTGYYNFYNIGAYNSTAYLGAVKNGLKFAKTGIKNNSYKNTKMMIPWTSPYKAIVGGSQYIGMNYISVGQNTLYLQRFNVTNKDRYEHQYMCNVEAACHEGRKVATAYDEISNHKGIPTIFSIPIYTNMPKAACKLPADKKNPNNYLRSLSVSGVTLSPKVSTLDTFTYKASVSSKVTSVTVNAKAASTLSKVSGTGKITLKKGVNKIVVQVTAQNNTKRNYVINITKQ